jgi:hypothetical protein
MPRYTEPEPDLALLLYLLKLVLPQQPLPRLVSAPDNAMPSTQNVVQTSAELPLKTNSFPAAYALKCESQVSG